MEDPNVIVTLIARNSRTERAFAHKHNADRYRPLTNVPAPFIGDETPFIDGQPEEKDVAQNKLELAFDNPPKDITQGFVFGWGPHCDVQLVDRTNLLPGDQNVQRVSRRHFSITFDCERRVVLRDTSTNGTSVSYDGQARDELRTKFTWIIFPECETIEVAIPRADISFKVKLRPPRTYQREFLANVDAVFPPSVRLGESGLRLTQIQIGAHSQITAVGPSGAATPTHRPIYVQFECIGEGCYAVVHKYVDASTGIIYAGKIFMKDVGEDRCLQEIAIMERLEHENIVRFVDFCKIPRPMIVMEYMPLGSLAALIANSKITYEESLSIVSQCLSALTYLHPGGYIHRDIKPANILVSCRQPLTVKLADLGFAKYGCEGLGAFQSYKGTPVYIAPEITGNKDEPYTQAADIWSLGVVALELVEGLPVLDGPHTSARWTRLLIDTVLFHWQIPLLNFLALKVLRYQARHRLSAAECLEEVLQIQRPLRSSSW